MKFLFVSTLFLISAALPALAGNGGRGGVPSAIDEAAFTTYIEGGGLKASMLYYLHTLDLNQIQDSPATHIKATFERMLADQELIKDIATTGNYVAGREKCHDPFDGQVLAYTHVGNREHNNIGGKICYDVKGLVEEFKNQGRPLTVDQAAIKLVALTFHEHVHHFQRNASDNSRVIQEQEKEANDLAGYVELTGAVARVPLVGWVTSVPRTLLPLPQNKIEVANCIALSGWSLWLGYRVALKMTIDLNVLSPSQSMSLMGELHSDFGRLINGTDVFKGPIPIEDNKAVFYSRLDFAFNPKGSLVRRNTDQLNALNAQYHNAVSVECWHNN